jgi:hypothetical protein
MRQIPNIKIIRKKYDNITGQIDTDLGLAHLFDNSNSPNSTIVYGVLPYIDFSK